MSDPAPICKSCTSVIVPEGAKDKHWQWLCIQEPIEPQTNYVSGALGPPYKRCEDLNKYGLCQKFTRGFNVFNPKTGEQA